MQLQTLHIGQDILTDTCLDYPFHQGILPTHSLLREWVGLCWIILEYNP